MASPIPLGAEGKVYWLSTGTRASWGTATNGVTSGPAPSGLVEITSVRDVDNTATADDADVSTRASRFAMSRGALIKLETELTVPWQPGDAFFTAAISAFVSGGSIAVAVLDGDKATIGSQGFWADWAVMELPRTEELSNAMVSKVKIKPTISAVPPEYVKVSS